MTNRFAIKKLPDDDYPYSDLSMITFNFNWFLTKWLKTVDVM